MIKYIPEDHWGVVPGGEFTPFKAQQIIVQPTCVLEVIMPISEVEDINATYTFECEGITFQGVRPEVLPDGRARFYAEIPGGDDLQTRRFVSRPVLPEGEGAPEAVQDPQGSTDVR